MPILRIWRAEIRRALRHEYLDYLQATGVAAYQATPGNLGTSIAMRDLDEERSEVATLSWWTGMDAIRQFAGDATERARYFPEDDRFLLTRPDTVVHFDATLSVTTAGGVRTTGETP
ncbi:MAG: hypothetical protein JSR36_16285 [Proteobacteria bacterium]|nr:hypothetical protein [Pseudomonadota bacterium]